MDDVQDSGNNTILVHIQIIPRAKYGIVTICFPPLRSDGPDVIGWWKRRSVNFAILNALRTCDSGPIMPDQGT